VDVDELIANSERKIDRLRAQLATEERFLKDLRKRMPAAPSPRVEVVPRLTLPVDTVQPVPVAPGRQASRPEKRALALAAMRAQPGTWTTKDLEGVFISKGIDPNAGTPAKNILWHLSREGLVEPAGHGAYHFDPDGDGAKIVELED
jgi:hypothetical protein